MARTITGLPEIWVPADVGRSLGKLLPDDLTLLVTAIDAADNTTSLLTWNSAKLARRAGIAAHVASTGRDRLIALKLVSLVDSNQQRGKGVHLVVKVRVGTGRSSLRLPDAAIWPGSKDDGPRWGADSGHAIRVLLGILAVTKGGIAPATTMPHDKIAAKVGLISSVYRRGVPLLADQSWVDTQERWITANNGYGASGVHRDSNRTTLRWDVLKSELADVRTLQTLAYTRHAHLEAANAPTLSAEHANPAAGGHANPAAGSSRFFDLYVPCSVASSSSRATQPPPRTQTPKIATGDGEAGQDQEKKREPNLTLVPAPSLTVSDVLNAESQDEAEALIRAAVKREGGWRALTDESWIAATVAAIYYAPDDHALPITEADARHLAVALLKRKADGFTPLALATQLVADHLNTGVRNTAAVLRHRLASIPDSAWRGSDDDPEALLTAQQMIPTRQTVLAHARQVDPRNPTGRDRSDGSTYSTTFD